MFLDKKEDGLTYAYKHRLVVKQDGEWRKLNDHYDRKAIYDFAEGEMQYGIYSYEGLAVLERFEGKWIVDINWLEQYRDNNRHNLTWKQETME